MSILGKRIIQELTVIVFLAMIAGSAIMMFATPDKDVSQFENLTLSQIPRYDGQGLSREFIDQVELYLNDQFGYREDFIYWHTYLNTFYLKKSLTPKVLIGQND